MDFLSFFLFYLLLFTGTKYEIVDPVHRGLSLNPLHVRAPFPPSPTPLHSLHKQTYLINSHSDGALNSFAQSYNVSPSVNCRCCNTMFNINPTKVLTQGRSCCAPCRSEPCSQSGRWNRHGDVSDGDWQGNQEVHVSHQPRELLGSGGPRRHREHCHWSVSESFHIRAAEWNRTLARVTSISNCSAPFQSMDERMNVSSDHMQLPTTAQERINSHEEEK